jgi:hypothetical protein
VSFPRTSSIEVPSSRRAVKAVAGALLKRGAIPGDEIKQIVDAEPRES